MNIVSLIASATEIVSALGFEGDLVGRSHECDYPPGVARLPAVTEPKFPTDGTSYAIDQRVKAILQEGLSVYRVHADALAALRPDVIVTQDQCRVCAVSLDDVEGALCAFVGTRPRVVSLQPDCLADVWADIRRVAAALGARERGEALVASLQARMAAVVEAARPLPRVSVATIEWIDPLMAAGNWMPELIDMAGGTSLFGEAGKHSPWMTFDALAAADPDVIFVSPCGFDLARTRAEMPALARTPGWSELRAVRGGRVVLADGNQYFNRPGPRLAESLEILAEALHPTLAYGHSGWERY
ncbi:MAG TPA: cobalamin-binding protein [Haliangiales bacterium]|nr:cobalamin-binding protein [Haliangiales bacterium]